MARLNQSSVVRRQESGDGRRETGDSFIYSPHTPHPTPHFPTSPLRRSFLRANVKKYYENSEKVNQMPQNSCVRSL
ncbi:MAG: hypothetical protein EWV40_07205 [Microcystis flos-aquae Mf_WU_F_19750830_S460]|uniref:Uncharacterized protein n=1 Tax=Microcystis flos-aquae Mf_WU_F_19750830_S460 TaxID=2486237 RepID=A0A552LV61_9CHRO|nr:MAG: hypothetical protein EWV40_07205 [Microcystis flos-aquae Mf_WU_F_19750830_S460]